MRVGGVGLEAYLRQREEHFDDHKRRYDAIVREATELLVRELRHGHDPGDEDRSER